MDRNRKKQLWVDKVGLTDNLLQKEGHMIAMFSDVLRRLNMQYLEEDELESDTRYNNCWSVCHELFMILRYNKIEESEDKVGEEEIQKLKEYMRDFQSRNKKGIKKLGFVVNTLCQIMSQSGYHEDSWGKNEDVPEFATNELE